MDSGGKVDGIRCIDVVFCSNLGGDSGSLRCKIFDFDNGEIKKLVIGMNNGGGIFFEGQDQTFR